VPPSASSARRRFSPWPRALRRFNAHTPMGTPNPRTTPTEQRRDAKTFTKPRNWKNSLRRRSAAGRQGSAQAITRTPGVFHAATPCGNQRDTPAGSEEGGSNSRLTMLHCRPPSSLSVKIVIAGAMARIYLPHQAFQSLSQARRCFARHPNRCSISDLYRSAFWGSSRCPIQV